MALLRDAKRCCVGAGATGEQGLGDEDTVEEAATAEAAAAEAGVARRALADVEGDGDAPRRGSGEEPATALAATLLDLAERAGALPRGSGVKRAGAAAACASTPEGAAAAPLPRSIHYRRSRRPREMEPDFKGLSVLLWGCWGCKARRTRDQSVQQLARGKERADTEELLSRIRES